MKRIKQLVCPISEERTNERITRFNALFTILFIVAAFVFNSEYFLIFLLADFFIRAFTRLNLSPICFLSSVLTNVLNLSKKEVGKAQKVFAARMGFVMTLITAILFFLDLNLAALIIAGILVFFATLEFALAVCVGCLIYSLFVLPFYSTK